MRDTERESEAPADDRIQAYTKEFLSLAIMFAIIEFAFAIPKTGRWIVTGILVAAGWTFFLFVWLLIDRHRKTVSEGGQ